MPPQKKSTQAAPPVSSPSSSSPSSTASPSPAANEQQLPTRTDTSAPSLGESDGAPTRSTADESAEAHPSGNLAIVQDGAAVGIKTYESVTGADGPNSQTELDASSDRGSLASE